MPKLNTYLLTTLICFMTLFNITGCAGFPTENPDPARNNKAAYNKDLKECQEDYPDVSSGAHIKQWISCMKLKGWK